MKAVIFDLDNTLFDVTLYNEGAFRKVTKYLHQKFGVDEQEAYHYLLNRWKEKTSRYSHLFDDVLQHFRLNDDVTKLVSLYNSHVGPLVPYSDVPATLEALRKMDYKLGIITDGNATRQRRKIELLNLMTYFDDIIFTSLVGHPKPSTVPYELALKHLNVKPEHSCYVGDNPVVDFEGAKKIGLKTIRILKGEFKDVKINEQWIDFEINEVREILDLISHQLMTKHHEIC